MQRFENQGETQRHLEDLKKDGEKKILRLQEEKEKLQQEFEEMKYSGEAKLSRWVSLLQAPGIVKRARGRDGAIVNILAIPSVHRSFTSNTYQIGHR